MTEYIKNQLIKLCDHPEWFNDMLISWDKQSRRTSYGYSQLFIPCTTKWITRKHRK